VRATSVWALKKLVDPKSANALKKLYRREKDEASKGRILRSMATVAPTDGVVISQIKKALQSDKSEIVRAHATVAAGILEDRAAVTECLRTALSDSTMLVRSVAAYVIAVRQDRELSDALRSTHAAETDAECKEWMGKAQTTIREFDPKPFEEFLKKTLDQRPTGRGRRGR
jgi:HEAT repeat protein